MNKLNFQIQLDSAAETEIEYAQRMVDEGKVGYTVEGRGKKARRIYMVPVGDRMIKVSQYASA